MNRQIEKHQLSGFDNRERGFSRPVDFENSAAGIRAVLRYETIRVTTEESPTCSGALERLVETLHAQGYRQLRSQLNFRAGVYLGSQEPWVEYPDPEQTPERANGLFSKLRRAFGL